MSNFIPLTQLTPGDLHNIQRLLMSKEAAPLMKLLSLTEREVISQLRQAKGSILFQAQGVAQFLDELDKIIDVNERGLDYV